MHTDTLPKSVAKRPQPKGGSRKGIPNKSTAAAREAIGRFVDGNAHRLQEWLDKIAEEEGPKAAFLCFKDLIEYHVPKLGRQELSGPEGESLMPPVIQIVAVDPK